MQVHDRLRFEGVGCHPGVLAALVDIVAGSVAARAAHPDWIATSDLELHVLEPVPEGELVARGSIVRAGRQTVVLAVELVSRPLERPVARATVSFARLGGERKGRGGRRTRDDTPDDTERQPEAAERSAEHVPVGESPLQRLQVEEIDPGAGVLELRLEDYVRNTLGALQGGVAALLLARAAEVCVRAVRGSAHSVSDLSIRYLRLGRRGPIRSRARLVRQTEPALVEVELVDAGADGRLVCAGTCILHSGTEAATA